MIYTSRGQEASLKEAIAVLVGIPWDSAEIGRSVKYGSLFIRQALRELEGFDPETKKEALEGLHDLGDLETVPANWGLTKERIIDTLDFIQKENARAFPIVLGGDHLITLGVLEALKKVHQQLTVVHFDAHADVSKEWLGEKYSHISWGYHAIKDLGLPLVQFGVRSMTAEESELIPSLGIKQSLQGVEGPVYLTVDMDVFDPAFAPEVGTPEPQGMEPKEFFSLLKDICKRPLVGMDIVECASTQVGSSTAVLAAHIIKKTLALKKGI